MVELVRSGTERFREIPIDSRTGDTPAVLLHLEGDLNFAVAEELADRLLEVGRRGPRVVVLRLKRARHLDATVLESLRQAAEELKRPGATTGGFAPKSTASSSRNATPLTRASPSCCRRSPLAPMRGS